jgi:cyclase
VTDVAGQLNIPFTVGGGIRNVGDASELLQSGADKISVNSAAFLEPEMIGRLASRFGSQCVVIAVDVKREENDWIVYISGGKERTGRKALDWILEAMDRGAGEVLLTSMDHDGTRGGFALGLLNEVSDTVGIPVIASGGAGNKDHFRELFLETGVDAALAAGIFHEGKVRIPDLKNELKMAGIPVRI